MAAEALDPREDQHEDNVVDLEEEVDLDLDAEDERLRAEALGKSSKVRVAGKVVHILPAGDWPSSAMRAATSGDWDTWAREVIEDDDEFSTWSDANLRNYQIEAVFTELGRKARMSMGKSQRRSGSRRNSQRR